MRLGFRFRVLATLHTARVHVPRSYSLIQTRKPCFIGLSGGHIRSRAFAMFGGVLGGFWGGFWGGLGGFWGGFGGGFGGVLGGVWGGVLGRVLGRVLGWVWGVFLGGFWGGFETPILWDQRFRLRANAAGWGVSRLGGLSRSYIPRSDKEDAHETHEYTCLQMSAGLGSKGRSRDQLL